MQWTLWVNTNTDEYSVQMLLMNKDILLPNVGSQSLDSNRPASSKENLLSLFPQQYGCSFHSCIQTTWGLCFLQTIKQNIEAIPRLLTECTQPPTVLLPSFISPTPVQLI